jgi:hypothetical protein
MRIGSVARTIATASVGLGLALGAPAVTNAKPVWDIGVYDGCIDQADRDFVNGVLTADQYSDQRVRCCVDSGGVWYGGPQSGSCGTPPPRTADAPPIAPGSSAGVSDDPTPGTPLPTPTPRPRPAGSPGTVVG